MMNQIGITFGAYGLDQTPIDLFIETIELAKPSVSYRIYPVITAEEALHTEPSGNKVFSRSKALNAGIKELSKDCEVIVCTDVDILVCPGALELSYGLAKDCNGNVFFMTRNIALDNYLNNKGDWSNHIRIPLRKTGKGGWNCMSTEAWFKSGGWNEQLYGYGAEDDERHERLEQQGFPFRTIIYSPILHINHPQRDQARRNFENMTMMRSRNWTKYNWLKE